MNADEPYSFSPPRNPRFRLLDAWRGLACLMIVACHAVGTLKPHDWESAGPTPLVRPLRSLLGHLFLGVPLFFVISGFCIAATVDSTRIKGHGCGTYFQRRFRRIFPPYWIFLGLLALLSLLVGLAGRQELLVEGDCRIPPPEALTPVQWLGNLTLTETWRPEALEPGVPRRFFFGPAWTLCYEEQFYAVCGLLLLLSPRRFWPAVAGVTLLTLPLTVMRFSPAHAPSVIGFFWDGHWLIFAAGLLAYYHVNHADARQRRWCWLTVALAVVAALALRYRILPAGEGDDRALAFEFVVGGVFAAILMTTHRWDDRLASVAVLRPLRFCGRICYSLYLMHWPVTILVSHGARELGLTDVGPTLLIVLPVATGLSILAAWLFHVGVEKRFLNQPVAAKMNSRALDNARRNSVTVAARSAVGD